MSNPCVTSSHTLRKLTYFVSSRSSQEGLTRATAEEIEQIFTMFNYIYVSISTNATLKYGIN